MTSPRPLIPFLHLRLRLPSVVAVCILMFVAGALPTFGQSTNSTPTTSGWGSLSGQIVYDGDHPVAEPLVITRDEEFCGQFRLIDESLSVHPDSRGLHNVVVWLDSRTSVPVHPDLQPMPDKLPALDNLNCRFSPRILTARTGQTVEFRNSDPVAHNVAVFAQRNQPFSEVVSATAPLQKKFAKYETLPVRVDCSIHSWMRSYLLVTDHPYAAVTDAEGRFRIANLPSGEWKFRFWHERPGNLRSLRQAEKDAPLDKGVWTLKIDPDSETDLGVLRASSAQFAARK